jgi:hypothetical protein
VSTGVQFPVPLPKKKTKTKEEETYINSKMLTFEKVL